MDTKKLKCPVCKTTVTGAGHDNMKKNMTLHLINEHNVKFESIIWDGYKVSITNTEFEPELPEEPVEEKLVKKVIEVVTPKVDNKVVDKAYKDMTKDELLDYSAQQGLTDEVKYSWKKSKIITALKRLLK